VAPDGRGAGGMLHDGPGLAPGGRGGREGGGGWRLAPHWARCLEAALPAWGVSGLLLRLESLVLFAVCCIASRMPQLKSACVHHRLPGPALPAPARACLHTRHGALQQAPVGAPWLVTAAWSRLAARWPGRALACTGGCHRVTPPGTCGWRGGAAVGCRRRLALVYIGCCGRRARQSGNLTALFDPRTTRHRGVCWNARHNRHPDCIVCTMFGL
jgi:hypothetical protein